MAAGAWISLPARSAGSRARHVRFGLRGNGAGRGGGVTRRCLGAGSPDVAGAENTLQGTLPCTLHPRMCFLNPRPVHPRDRHAPTTRTRTKTE
eukprot:4333903-Pyramimonas_sp.AAC.1